MEYIFCYSMMVYGLCVILIESYGPFNIIEYFRQCITRISPSIGKMFECFICTSTNVGWAVVLAERTFDFNISPISKILLNESLLIAIPCNMFFTCGVVWVLRNVVTLCEKQIESN